MRHNGCMSFPLGSLLNNKDGAAAATANAPADKVYKRQAKKPVAAAPPRVNPLRTPVWLLIGALLWCLLLLAMLTHDPADAAFSISGSRELTHNRVGALGAWASDLLLFCFGYSAWWLPLVGLRLWLTSLAGLLRADVPPLAPSWRHTALWWLGLLLLVSASCALEWTRLYLWEPHLPGHAGGVLGYSLGPISIGGEANTHWSSTTNTTWSTQEHYDRYRSENSTREGEVAGIISASRRMAKYADSADALACKSCSMLSSTS